MKNSPSEALPADLLWEIDRFLLGDETLDRSEFEERMLANPDVALAVADELQRLELLAAGLATDRFLPASYPVRRHGRRWGAFLVPCAVATLAAMAMWLWVNWQVSMSNSVSSVATAFDGQLPEVARQWVELDGADESQASHRDFDERLLDIREHESDPTIVSDEAAESDWLLEAAADFFEDVAVVSADATS